MCTQLEDLIKEDSILPPHIKYTGDVIKSSEINAIFLTGVTGYLGTYLLQSLLKNENVRVVYCLVRERSIKIAEDLVEFLKTDRVVILAGDLSQDNMGLSQETYEELSNKVDTVLHIAVKSHHLEEYKRNEGTTSDIRTVNVLGTIKILEFACHGKSKRILYASSVGAVNRLSEDKILPEELIDESNFGDGISMGYFVSKFVSEKLLCEAICRGIFCLIIRYAAIVCETESGKCTLRKFDYKGNHIFRLWISYLQTRQRPVYMSAYPTVPVDFCADVTLDLLFHNDVTPGIFNLTNPHGSQGDDFVTVADKLGFQLSKVDYKTFAKTLIEQDKKSILYPLRKLYFQEDSAPFIRRISFYATLMLQENAGDIVNKISDKFKKFVPDYEKRIDTPNEIIHKMLLVADLKSFL